MFSVAWSLVVLVCAYISYSFVSWYRLSHVPGPFWAGLTSFWLIREVLFGRQPITLRDVTNKYGTIARVGPNAVVTNDPEILRKIMSVRSSYTRGPWYDAWKLEAGRQNVFSMRDEVAHTKLRSKMTAGYSGKENESMEKTIESQIANLVKLIRSKYISTTDSYRPVDLAEKLQYFTLDTISDLAFGKPLGYLQQDADPYDYLEAIDASMPVYSTLGNLPWLANLLHSPLFRRFLPSERDKGGFGAIIGFSKQVVNSRFAPNAISQPDMLGSFIRHGMTKPEAYSESLIQVVAGTDTTATGLKTIFLHVMTRPSIYRKLQAEIEQGLASGAISSPIQDAEARRLPYLQAVIKEGLRIRSPAAGTFFKSVPRGGDVLGEIALPGGTQIGVSHLSFLHSKAIFGHDAETFRPERWIEAAPEHLGKMNRVVDTIFHSGRFQCLGKNVALMEYNKIFVELLRRFEFEVVDAERPARITNAGYANAVTPRFAAK
ncbi:hypothetical protein E8E13_004378 [Curvularia kusanoi]|uniref:Cytochrome P450 n=1 Tax=Curvularia kusanoi TaxID=90978 RepID=A0A9P4T873_CURKU|nr:hypothetical protein E8E13_004378 [Curvularia kusanoi]